MSHKGQWHQKYENGTPRILIAIMTPTCPPIWELFTPGIKAPKPHQKFTCEISSLTNVTFSYNPKKCKTETDYFPRS